MLKLGFITILLIQWISLITAQGVGCGRQAAAFLPIIPAKQARIIGGSQAVEYSWPWQVSLRKYNQHYCGGSLLRVRDDREESDLILTAGHCIPFVNEATKQIDFSDETVVAGTNTKNSVTPGQETRRVVQIVYHKNYIYENNYPINDIAIYRLDRPIKFSDKIRPICLNVDKDKLPIGQGRVCISTGWGRNVTATTAYNAQDELKQAVSPMHSVQDCKTIWQSSSAAWNFAYLCAGQRLGITNVCTGDSGGPLVCQREDGVWIQYGIASFVAGNCAATNYPSVYSHVANYVPWIRENVKISALLKA